MTTTATPFDWSAVAPAWEARRDHISRTSTGVVDTLLDHLAPGPGARVLELGAGTGDVAVRLSALVGPEGSVLASDVARGMVDVIARTCAGLANVTPLRADACDIPLPDASVDAVLFQMGLMFVPTPVTAVQEVRRVLAPGGRFAAATWAGPEHNPWLTCMGMAAMTHGVAAGGPPTEPGGLFSLATTDALRAVVQSGGFTDVVVDEVALELRFESLDDYVDHVSHLSGPLAAALASAPEKADEVRATAAQLASGFVAEGAVVMPARALVAAAAA